MDGLNTHVLPVMSKQELVLVNNRTINDRNMNASFELERAREILKEHEVNVGVKRRLMDSESLSRARKELKEVLENDVFQGEGLLETNPDLVLDGLDRVNVIVNVMNEIYTIIRNEANIGVPNIVYHVFTKLSNIYLVCTGNSLMSKMYTSFCDGIIRAFIDEWLYKTKSLEEILAIERHEAFMETVSEDSFQAEGLVDNVRKAHNISTDALSLTESDFGQKLTTFCSLLICVPFINQMGLTPDKCFVGETTAFFLKKKYAKCGMSVPLLLIESSTSIFLKLVEVCSVGPSALYVSSDDHNTLETNYQWLRRNNTNFFCCTEAVDVNGQNDAFTLEGYAHKCSVTLELINKVLPCLKKHPYALMRIEKQKNSIIDWQNDCYSALRANVTRPQPFSICLVGTPGIGKSALQDISLQILHDADNKQRRFEHKYQPNLVYYYNPNDKFYSLFSSTHTSLVLDDLAQKKPDLMVALGGDDIMDVIRIINTQPFFPEQAELHLKGKVPMRCRYVFATTNTESLNAEYVFNNAAAVHRRFIFVRCSVKEQYQDEVGSGLRGDLSNPHNVNLWDFTIVKHFPIGKTTIKKYYDRVSTRETGRITWTLTQSSNTLCDMHDYCNFLRVQLEAHWKQQAKSRIIANILEKEVKCICGVPISLCDGTCFQAEGYNELYRWWYGSWIVSDFIFVALFLAFIPTWWMSLGVSTIYSVMARTREPTSFFGNLFTAINTIWLVSIIIPCLTFTGVCEYFSPSNLNNIAGKPRWSTRLAMYLIPRLPRKHSLQMIYMGKRFKENVHNFMTCNYYMEWIEENIHKGIDGYTFFKTHVLQDWRFQSCIAFIAIVKVLRAAGRTFTPMAAEAHISKMPEPDSHEIVAKNHWNKTHDIGVFPNYGRTISKYDLDNQVILNTVQLQLVFIEKRNTLYCNGLILCGNLIVTIAHMCNHVIPDYITIRRFHKNGQFSEIKIMCDHTNVKLVPERDLMFLTSNRIIPGRDLSKYLVSNKEPVHINSGGTMFSLPPKTDVHDIIKFSQLTNKHNLRDYVFDGVKYNAVGRLFVVYDSKTNIGYCGAPLVVNQGIENAIIGIHCAGNQNKSEGIVSRGLVAQIYREDIDTYGFKKFEVPNDADNDISFVMNAEAMNIDRVHPKCVTNLVVGEYHVIGSSKLPRARPHTNVANTPYCDTVVEYFSKNTKFTRVLHTSPIKCDPKKAILLALEPCVRNAQFFPSEIEFVVDCMSKEFISRIEDVRLKRMFPVPWSVAVNGVDGIPYMDRVNMSTSSGYGHPGPKKQLFILRDSTPEHLVCYEIGLDLQKEIDYIYQCYGDNIEANPVFKCSFKDEPITFEKADMHKVRIFSCSPIAFSLVARKFYLPFIRECVGSRRLDFEMGIGANAHGTDWQNIYNHVVKHGEDRCFAGDYKAFDKQMSPELILGAFKIIYEIYIKSGWSEEDLRFARCIAKDTAFPTTDLFGTLVQFYGSNPSGHILTTQINSLVNSLYMRLACLRIFKNNGYQVGDKGNNIGKYVNLSRFNDIMSLVTYGDDNCGSISNKFPFINHTSIQSVLGEAGIVYTMDVKNATSIDFVNVKDITFLKRHFVNSVSLNRVVGPLLEESIFKCLTVWTTSKSINEKEQMASVLSAMNREYFLYGEQIFMSRHSFFCNLVILYDLQGYVPGGELESYDALYKQYREM